MLLEVYQWCPLLELPWEFWKFQDEGEHTLLIFCSSINSSVVIVESACGCLVFTSDMSWQHNVLGSCNGL